MTLWAMSECWEEQPRVLAEQQPRLAFGLDSQQPIRGFPEHRLGKPGNRRNLLACPRSVKDELDEAFFMPLRYPNL